MLSKVAKRVRRQSLPQPTSEAWTEVLAECVQDAPDLLRWSAIPDTPFPRVVMGGYTRFYANSKLLFPPSPSFCPLLSQFPEGSPSKQVPSTAPLFSSPIAQQQRLIVIHEASRETMASTSHSRDVSSSTSMSPKSLRRRRRQLLRTPSIERDFAVHAQQLFASNASDNETTSFDSPASPGSAHSHSSSDLQSSRSEGHHFEEPTTPTTSVEGGDEDELNTVENGDKEKWVQPRPKSSPSKRPDSETSYSTAKSDFDDI
ncbi:hypothetical protein JR316_0013209 [Psilocybe cubensis]|uniref:Uncharacterized protein n=2 Tax=Psilocybe cubensis TaxID=181762 RepID=A0ACB8GGK5_PSICU|nr:hypothetical protein JR316_0013209 [Psilocybe cubensis]KAH9474744.1 hypothetical protein JR316_0013209 [Psilocybe cubensis]